ncbi:MAG TPA: hypothetical protein PLZ86_08700 [bacterium]|nr:hypothetical protein [bacterium]
MPESGENKQYTKHTAEFQKKASELKKDVQDLGKIGREIASDAAGIAQERASEYYRDGVREAKHLEKALESEIKHNPIRSVLIAAGVGLLLGALWRR